MSLICAVTGANRGIGFALVRELCQRVPEGSTVYLLAREFAKAQEACDKLCTEAVSFHALPTPQVFDLNKVDTITAFANFISTTHGKIDVFINNAGATSPSPDEFDPTKTEIIAENSAAVAENLFQANNKGQGHLIRALFPLLAPKGRMVLFASGFGVRASMVDEHVLSILGKPDLSVADVVGLEDEFLVDVRSMKTAEFAKKWKGWPNFASKVLQVAGMRGFVHDEAATIANRGNFICSVCPGWTITDASKPYLDENNKFGDIQALPAPESAKFIINVALCSDEAKLKEFHGQLVQYEKVLPF